MGGASVGSLLIGLCLLCSFDVGSSIFFGTCGKSQHLVINLIFFCPDSPMKTRDRDRLHSEALQSGSSHQDILRSHTVSPCHTTHPAQDQTDQKVAAVPEMEQSEVKR